MTRGVRTGITLLALVVCSTLVAEPSAQGDTTVLNGTVDKAGTAFRSHKITIGAAGTITATLDWDNVSANLRLFLYDPTGALVWQSPTAGKPKTMSFDAPTAGAWKLGVKALSGSAAYTLSVAYPGSGSAGGPATYSGVYGFSGSAGLYAYGMDWDSTDNTILVGDYWNYRVWRYDTDGNLIGSVSQHALGGMSGGITAPYDVEADPTDLNSSGKAALWVADQGSSRIVEFDHNGNWLQTIGPLNAGQASGTDAQHPGHNYAYGCGGGQMHIPTHILVDTVQPSHLIYVSDPNCRAVYIFDHSGTFQGSLDWTGSGVGTPIPRGVAEDAAGDIYVAEFNSRKIFVFSPTTRKIIGVIGPQSDENDVRGIDIDPVNHLIYTVGAYWNRVYEFSYDPAKVAVGTGPSSVVGTFVNEWRNIDGTNYASGHQSFDSIRFPAVDGRGNVYVGETWGCDTSCNGTPYGYGVEKFAPGNLSAFPSCNVANGGTAQTTCAGATRLPWATGPQPPPEGGFNQQNGIGLDPSGNLYVIDTFEQRVQKFDTTKTCGSAGNCPAWELQWGSRAPNAPKSQGFGYPRTLTVGDDGRIWVGDNNNDVLAFNPDGSFVHRYGSQGKSSGQFSGGVQGIDVEGGRVYATDVGGCRLQVFDEAKLLTADSIANAPAGTLLDSLGTCGTAANQMKVPRGVAVSSDGNTAYVVDTGANRISVWNLSNNTATTSKPSCGGTLLSQPWGITWDPARTWLYIGDVGNKRIVRWDPVSGTCQVVATTATLPAGYTMDGSNYLAFGPDGRLYASDNSRHIYAFTITG
jgi:sugar lactone lactonase YvrE